MQKHSWIGLLAGGILAVTGCSSGGGDSDSATPGISLETLVNSQDADTPPGPTLEVGDTASFVYRVNNSGDTALSAVTVSDDSGLSVSCARSTLAAGESMDCSASALVQEGAYASTGQVSAQAPDGSSVQASDPVNYLGEVPIQPMAVSGKLNLPDGSPVVGASVEVLAPDEDEIQAKRNQRIAQYGNWKIQPKSSTSVGAQEVVRLKADVSGSTTTDANGEFSLTLNVPADQRRMFVTVSYTPSGGPEVNTGHWANVQNASVSFGSLMLPDAANAAATVDTSAGTARTSDGRISISGLPGNITELFAQSFDPGDQGASGDPSLAAQASAFPGNFDELDSIDLNSSAFAWVEARDANGDPVSQFSQAVTMRLQVPRAQWADLEDIRPGTDRIELPIYAYNENLQMWEQQLELGWLEDAQGTLLPEDAQPVVLDGSYAQELFAVFPTDHFSWMNVDYPFIGPWTLSRLDRNFRNNDCLAKATKLARTIFRTSWANTAYAAVNKPNVNINDEVKDGKAPEFKNVDFSGNDANTYGEMRAADFKEHMYLNSKLWDACDTKKKETIFLMAATILHETAHWKHDAKLHDGVYSSEADAEGEAGLLIEKKLFGGSIWTHDGKMPMTSGLRIDKASGGTTQLTSAMLDKLTSETWWKQQDQAGTLNAATFTTLFGGGGSKMYKADEASPLTISIAIADAPIELGNSIPVDISFQNTGANPIQVMDFIRLEGYPLYFVIQDASGAGVEFIGAKTKLGIGPDDFTTLNAGESLNFQLDLVRDGGGNTRYNFVSGGQYTAQAVYLGFFGLPQTHSNTETFELLSGGALEGLISNASSGGPLGEARIEVRRSPDGEVLLTAVSDVNGRYAFAELPPGSYHLTVRAPGFLRQERADVSITTGQLSTENFSLSPLLAAGNLQLVLTWGTTPSDLDSHLWLPMETPYHLYYSRRGLEDGCPFAALDVDDTSGEGPETITLTQLFPGTYRYAIYNYSGSPAITASNGHVDVFDASGLVTSLDVPATGSGRWWHVLDFTRNADGTISITEVNTVGESPEIYGDAATGCEQTPTPSR